MNQVRAPYRLRVAVSVLLIMAATAACGASPHSTPEATRAPSQPSPTSPSVSLVPTVIPAATTEPAANPPPTQTTAPPATATSAKPQQPSESQSSSLPAPVATPKTPTDPRNHPYKPTRAALAVPQPGPNYDIVVSIQGYTTYLFAYRGSHHSVVVAEPTRLMPGMYEKYVALSPDHRTVTYATMAKYPRKGMDMWSIGVNGASKRLLAHFDQELWVERPVWSPDSKQIAYVRTAPQSQAPGIELWTMNADGSNNRLLVKDPSFNTSVFYGSDPQPMGWTSYGDIWYKDYQDGQVWTVDTRTGNLSYVKENLQQPTVAIPIIKTKYPIQIYSQNDPRWRYQQLHGCGYSMGDAACALTSVTMSFSAYGVETDPAKLNSDLKDYACPVYWSWASKYFSDNKLELWGVWAFDWYSLDLALRLGRPAMVWLSDAETTGDSLLTHWVLVVGGSGQTPSGYRIFDPWDGTTYKTLAYYTSKGYGLTRVYVYGPREPKKPKHHHAHHGSKQH